MGAFVRLCLALELNVVSLLMIRYKNILHESTQQRKHELASAQTIASRYIDFLALSVCRAWGVRPTLSLIRLQSIRLPFSLLPFSPRPRLSRQVDTFPRSWHLR